MMKKDIEHLLRDMAMPDKDLDNIAASLQEEGEAARKRALKDGREEFEKFAGSALEYWHHVWWASVVNEARSALPTKQVAGRQCQVIWSFPEEETPIKPGLQKKYRFRAEFLKFENNTETFVIKTNAANLAATKLVFEWGEIRDTLTWDAACDADGFVLTALCPPILRRPASSRHAPTFYLVDLDSPRSRAARSESCALVANFATTKPEQEIVFLADLLGEWKQIASQDPFPEDSAEEFFGQLISGRWFRACAKLAREKDGVPPDQDEVEALWNRAAPFIERKSGAWEKSPALSKTALTMLRCAEIVSTTVAGYDEQINRLRALKSEREPFRLFAELGAYLKVGSSSESPRDLDWVEKIHVPIVFVAASDGVNGTLRLDLMKNGEGKLYPAPEMYLVPRDDHFQDSLDRAVEFLKERGMFNPEYDVRWKVSVADFQMGALQGGSLGVALIIAMAQLMAADPEQALTDFEEKLPSPAILEKTVFSGAVSAVDGELTRVECNGVWAKITATLKDPRISFLVLPAVAATEVRKYFDADRSVTCPNIFTIPKDRNDQSSATLTILCVKTLEEAFDRLASEQEMPREIDSSPVRCRKLIARPWLEKAIEDLADCSREGRGNGITLIVGQAGTGKTGLIKYMATKNRDEGNPPIVHFIRRKAEKTDAPEEFIGSMCAALRRKHCLSKPVVEHDQRSASRAVAAAQELLLILKQLSEKGIEETIWLDGLDEAYGDRGSFRSEAGAMGEVLKAMDSLKMERLPRGCRIVATSRPPGSHNHLYRLGIPPNSNLIDLDDKNNEEHIKDDLRRFFAGQFPNMGKKGIESTVEIVRRDRPFLHANLWKGVKSNEFETLDELLIEEILQTSRRWRNAMPNLGEEEAKLEVLDVLGLLSCARRPVSARLLESLFGEEDAGRIEGIADCAMKIGLLAEPDGEGGKEAPLAFFHDYIAEFILRESACPSHASPLASMGTSLAAKKGAGLLENHWHSRFVAACEKWKQIDDPKAREYSLRFLLSHQRFAEDWPGLEKTATDLGFLEAKLKADANGIFDFIRLLHKALEGVPQLPPDYAARSLLNDILEALAPNAEPISKEPLLALQQIHNDLLKGHKGESWFIKLCERLETIESRGGTWLKTEKSAGGPRPVKLDPHRNVVHDVAFTRINDTGGCLLATAGADQAIHLWMINPSLEYLYPIRLEKKKGKKKLSWKSKLDYPVTGIAFFEGGKLNPGGKILVCSSGRGLTVFAIDHENLQNRPRKIERFGLLGLPQRMAASQSEKFPFVVVGNGDGRARVMDVQRQCEITILGRGKCEAAPESRRDGESFCCVAMSPDGSLVAVANPHDNFIEVWKLSTDNYGGVFTSIGRELIFELPPTADRLVNAMAFSPDGRFLAVGGGFRHGQVEVWDLTNGSCVRFPAHNDAIWSLAFARDPHDAGQLLLFTGSYDRSAAAWDCAAIAKMARMDTVKMRELVGYARSREKIFLLRDFDRQPPPRVLVGHPDVILCLGISPGSGHFITGGTDYSASFWDLKHLIAPSARDPEPLTLHPLSDAQTIHAAAILPGGKKYATAGNFGGVRIRISKTGETLHPIQARGGIPVRTIRASANGRLLAYGTDYGVSIFDVEAGAEIQQSIPGHIYSVAFSREEERPSLAAGDSEGNVIVNRDLSGGQPDKFEACHVGKVRGLAYFPDNRWLVSVGDDSKVVLIDLNREFPPFEILSRNPHFGRIKSVAVSPCGNYIATGGQETIKIWQREGYAGTWHQKETLCGHRNEIWTLAFSNNGKLIASGGHDSTARVWDVETGKQLACLPCWNNVFAVCFGKKDRKLHVVDAGQTGSMPTFWNAEIRGHLG